MADQKANIRVNVGVDGQESLTDLAHRLDQTAKVLGDELAADARKAAAELRKLAEQKAAIADFERLQVQAREAARALQQAEREAKNFATQIGASGPPTAAEAASLQRLGAAAETARGRVQAGGEALAKAEGALGRYGISAKDTAAAQQRIAQETEQVRARVAGLVPAYQGAAGSAQAAGQTMVRTHRQIGDGVQSISEQIQLLQRAYAGFMALQGAGHMVRGLAETADAFNNLQARVKLAVGEGRAFESAWAGVAGVAQRTSSSLEATAGLFARLTDAGKSAGLATQQASQQALQLAETINQAAQLSGGGAQAANAAITQLIQGFQSGVLRGDEFNSVMEQAPRLSKALADGLGVTTGELRKMAEAGALTSDVVIRSLQSQAAAVQGEFAQMPATIGRALENLSTAWTQYVGQADKGMGASSAAAQAIQALAQNLNTVITVLLDAGKAVAAFAAVRWAQELVAVAQASGQVATQTAAATARVGENTLATQANTLAKQANATMSALAAEQSYAIGTAHAQAAKQAGVLAGAVGVLGTALSGMAALGRGALAVFGGIPGIAAMVAINARDIGTWIGEAAAKLMGARDRTAELAAQEKELAERARQAQQEHAALAAQAQAASDAQFGLGKAARATVAAFEAQIKEGKSAAEAIAAIGKDFDLSTVPGIRDAAAVLDKLVSTGRISAAQFQQAWAGALKGQDLGVFEAHARAALLAVQAQAQKTGAALKDAIARGVEGKELDAFKQRASDAFQAAERGGTQLQQELDAKVGEALRRAGTSAQELKTGFSDAMTSSLNDVDALADALQGMGIKGEESSRLLATSLGKALDTATTEKAVQAVINRMQALGKAGLLTGDQLAVGLTKARAKLDDLKAGINSNEEAMRKLGITSDAVLKEQAKQSKEAYAAMAASGTASARELGEAFKKAAEDAIKANNGVAPEWVKSQAAVRGFALEVDQAGKTTVKAMGEAGKAVDGVRKKFDEFGAEINAMGERINQLAGSLSKVYEAETAARAARIDANRIGGATYNKDNWATDKDGKVITAGSYLPPPDDSGDWKWEPHLNNKAYPYGGAWVRKNPGGKGQLTGTSEYSGGDAPRGIGIGPAAAPASAPSSASPPAPARADVSTINLQLNGVGYGSVNTDSSGAAALRNMLQALQQAANASAGGR